MLDSLIKLNPKIKILSIDDSQFSKFGQVLHSKPYQPVFSFLENQTHVPSEGNTYIANDEILFNLCDSTALCHDVFGNMPLQYGYVNGMNSKLNALEYHKSSEINIALTPLVLLLSKTDLMNQNTLNVDHITAFYVPERTVIELFPLTLHFSPCKVDDKGFKCGVILPYGTNQDFVKSKFSLTLEDALLFKTNKWIIVHPEHTKFVELNAHVGLIGPNLKINYK